MWGITLIQRVKKFISDIYQKREILFELAERDFQKQYTGSYLGFVWVYLQPLLLISIMYIVFTSGLKTGASSDGTPFVVYLITGIVAWFYIAENLNAITSIIIQHTFLLKKVDFRLSLLPIVKLMSSFVPHVFLLFISLVIAYINDISLTIHVSQLIYYYFSMVALLLGIGWITSSSRVFVSDVSKFISLITTFGFWLTPIFWDIQRIPEKYHWIVNLNPALYIVQGYRDSIITHTWFWERPYETLYFWSFTIATLLLGITVFRRLRPHFAEVA